MIRQDHGFGSPHEPFARATLRDKKKKERRGLRKRGVKIHPFHLPWIRACNGKIISINLKEYQYLVKLTFNSLELPSIRAMEYNIFSY